MMDKKYKVNNTPIKVELIFNERGMLLSDDERNEIKKGTVEKTETTDSGTIIEMYKIKDKDVTVHKEFFEFIRPGWKLANRVDELSVVSSLAGRELDLSQLAFNQLRYYLKKSSVVKIELKKDIEGSDRITNLDDIIGQEGLRIEIVNELLKKFQLSL